MNKTLVGIFAGIVVFGWMMAPARAQQPAAIDMNAQINGYEGAAHSSFVGIPTDWSTSHIVFSQPEPGSDAEDKVQQDPRYWLQQIRRAQLQSDDSFEGAWNSPDLPDAKPGIAKKKKSKKAKLKKDWSESLGGTGAKVGAGFFPAKYSYGTSSASCTDYVAFNTSLAGSATQASIISFTNLYTGGCTGTVPTTQWAYNTGGTVVTSLTPSFDGTQVAFVQSVGTTANLVLLKWLAGPASKSFTATATSGSATVTTTTAEFSAADVGVQFSGAGITAGTTITTVNSTTSITLSANAGAGAGTHTYTINAETAVLPGVPTTATAANYRTCTAPCMTTIAFSGTPNDTNSSPYYVFAGTDQDVIFVGDDTGHLHKFTNIFLTGTPAEVTTGGFPVTAAIEKLSGPVYDQTSGKVEVVASYDGTNNGARLHEVTVDSGTPTVTDSTILGATTTGGTNCAGTTVTTGTALTLDAPIVDQTAGTTGTIYVFIGNDGETTPNSAVYQFASGFGEHTCGNKAVVGAGSTTTGTPVYAGSFDNLYFKASTPTGNLYVCGTAGGSPQLWRIPIAANVLGTPVGITATLATAATTCSPVTEFLNGTTDQAFVSVEASGRPTGCAGGGCVMSFNISAALAASATPSSSAAESGGTSGIVVDNSATTSGASQVYFSTLGSALAVQAAQSGL
jgi:hypothetical protein